MKTHKNRGPFLTSADAKKAGWFSRRYKTSERHRNAQKTWSQRLRDKLSRVKDT